MEICFSIVRWLRFPAKPGEILSVALVETVASCSVATIGGHAIDIRNILLRMALSDGSRTTKAVMQCILAISSLHRFGPRPQAINLKLSALRTLAASLAAGIDTKEALQHIAAGMLLCTFEVSIPQQNRLSMTLTVSNLGPKCYRYKWTVDMVSLWRKRCHQYCSTSREIITRLRIHGVTVLGAVS